jgi:hypothetical protein
MSMDQNRLILFERFLSLDLPANELHTFNRLLESDSAFRREYEQFELITRCVHRYGELSLRTELLQWHNEAIKTHKHQNAGMQKVLYTLLFAGIFALSFFLFRTLENNSSEHKFKELFGLYPIQLPQRNQTLTGIQTAFDRGDINSTIEALSKTQPNQLSTHYRSFYRAVCYLALDPPKINEAKTDLHEVLSVSGPYSDDAHWYLALAFLYEGETGSARSHLESISAAYHPEAVKRFYQILDR